MGPKLAIPSASNPPQPSSTASTAASASSGRVVGICTRSWMSSGPRARMQTIFVPPNSMPATNGGTRSILSSHPMKAAQRSRGARAYSTVTDLARLRGWSTSVPFATAT
ncbi:hypothetical protein WR25_27251 [Diploscapter pachys]|uniref:Uncharacterized protein n=1 Tax=Diploscapter pachys TaxID=2018661 RepID=A0A2A2M4T0_9BILA|nr:hypothetical protein WR25_27251 [Diploscapter pachys]